MVLLTNTALAIKQCGDLFCTDFVINPSDSQGDAIVMEPTANTDTKGWLYEFADDGNYNEVQDTFCFTYNNTPNCIKRTLFMSYEKESRYCKNASLNLGCIEYGNRNMTDVLYDTRKEQIIKVLDPFCEKLNPLQREIIDTGEKTVSIS